MKKIIIIIIVALTFTACEDKIIDLVIKINETFDFSADNNGSFTETYTATRSEIVEDFDYDVSGIEDVNISFVELLVEPAAGNQATRIRISGTFSDNTTSPVFIFQDFELNIDDFTGTAKPISGYQSAGINALAEKLRNYINETDNSSFTLQITGVAIDAAGNPVSEAMNFEVSITLDAEVIFEEEASLPSFP
ncbi:MAG: hypothetical protein ACOCXH_06925 [Cyclobacteriaceae bacterium]